MGGFPALVSCKKKRQGSGQITRYIVVRSDDRWRGIRDNITPDMPCRKKGIKIPSPAAARYSCCCYSHPVYIAGEANSTTAIPFIRGKKRI
jgi:hypothetical protein